MNIIEKKHAILVTEFDRYTIDHPDFAAKLPPGAQIILQIEGDDQYNEWSKNLADHQREANQPVIFIKIEGLKPVKSRLIRPKVLVSY